MTIQPTAAMIQTATDNSLDLCDWTIAIGEQSSTPLMPLGTVVRDKYGREWIYAIANGNVAAGYVAQMAWDGSYDMTPATTTTVTQGGSGPGTEWAVLAAPDIAVTDNYYAWFWMGGGTFELALENHAISHAASDVLYTTAAAGILGADSSSFQVDGIKSIDEGAGTSTRVTVWAADRLTAGVVEAHD